MSKVQTIAQMWADFEKTVVASTAGPVQRREMKMSFYGGAAAILGNQLNIAEEIEDEEKSVVILQSLHQECRDFATEYLMAQLARK